MKPLSLLHPQTTHTNNHHYQPPSFFISLLYFTILSILGFLLLFLLPSKHSISRFDLLFTSVSSVTLSSMSSVEIESFSNSQLMILTLLMLFGGEAFSSSLPFLFYPKKTLLKHLGYSILAYLVLVHSLGSCFILTYLSLFPTYKKLLRQKNIYSLTFSVFLTVSSFANCGFVPTNENMIVFKNCSGMLIVVALLILLGNTLYPVGLRLFLRMIRRSDLCELGYEHLMRGKEMVMLGTTVVGFVVVQFVVFCSLEWRSEELKGMGWYRKMVAGLFMAVNSRHSGEMVVDLSVVSQAVVVLYVVMMYLPPYMTFRPVSASASDKESEGKDDKNTVIQNILLSPLSYLAAFVIIICITERRNVKEDPLNFSVLNIVVEVISAYGNVGFSTGYSCDRQLIPDMQCKQSWIGFSGKWSKNGKFVLIVVMFFGRLKKFSLNGGKAWELR